MDRLTKMTVLLCGLTLVAGCDMLGGFGVSSSQPQKQQEPQQPERYVRVWLDDHPAEPGDATCQVATPVSCSPKLKYEITQPAKLGRVSSVIINIFREFDGGWSGKTDYIIIATDTSNPDAQMKPGVVYDLAAPGEALRIMDHNNKTVEGVKLEPGLKYLMNFVVSADKSETASIEFSTR